MYHIEVRRRGHVTPHAVMYAETEEGCAVVEAVAWLEGYVTKVAYKATSTASRNGR